MKRLFCLLAIAAIAPLSHATGSNKSPAACERAYKASAGPKFERFLDFEAHYAKASDSPSSKNLDYLDQGVFAAAAYSAQADLGTKGLAQIAKEHPLATASEARALRADLDVFATQLRADRARLKVRWLDTQGDPTRLDERSQILSDLRRIDQAEAGAAMAYALIADKDRFVECATGQRAALEGY